MIAASLALAGGAASSAVAAAPDGRVYERVSPELKYGPVSFPAGYTSPQSSAGSPGGWNSASPDGNSVMYFSWSSFEGAPSGMQSTYKSNRTPQGWTTANWSPTPTAPHPSLFKGMATVVEANDDLSIGLFQTYNAFDPLDQNPTKIDEDPGEYDVYLTHGPGATPVWQSRPNGQVPASANIPSRAAAMSEDGRRVLFETREKLLPETAGESPAAAALYERVDGETKLVAVDSQGAPIGACGAVLGAYSFALNGNVDAIFGGQYGNARNALSHDGQRVFFSAPDPTAASSGDPGCADPPQLYVRKGTETIRASRSRRAVADPGGPQRAVFQGASADGSRAFFLTTEALTDDAPAGTGKALLYSYATADDTLSFVAAIATPAPAGFGGGGAVVGISSDGTRAYFVDGDSMKLHQFTAGQGITDLVTFTDPADVAELGQGYTRSAVLSPDAHQLAFLATSDLTGASGGVRQLYTYDTDAHQLTCVSCNTDGHVPLGPAQLQTPDASGAQLIAATALHSFSDDGSRIVFQSDDRLAPQDVNGKPDVYLWEGGRARLVSDGTDSAGSFLFDVADDLNDIFFATTAALDPGDRDGGDRDIYDARVGGGFPAAPPTPSPCVSDACQGVPAVTPAPLPAGSLTITGGGDPPSTRRARPTATVSVATVKAVRGSTAKLKVRVSGAGSLAVTGASVAKVIKTTTKAGTYAPSVRLTAAARRSLKQRRTLKVAMKVTFTPRSGRAVAKTITVTFRQPKAGR